MHCEQTAGPSTTRVRPLRERTHSARDDKQKKARSGTAEQAAEKGLKVVILAVFSSFSYSQVVDSWFERMGKLLTWFLLQQPVKPCPDTNR
jgi:hypothetical protein